MAVKHVWWGHLGGPVQKGIVTYSISPYQQRAFAGAIKHGVFNVFRRTISQAPYVGVPVTLGYLIYYDRKKRHDFLASKAGKEELLKW
ncbi:15380_t:CDS:2 [Funneliformis geosporum]|uniref:Cytochrome b-c1 complex subunit 8 n=1 Tax=Funneliformis geosporum TaxID=1117311 RepID=A0A9W4SKQ1_9GLOM|nr:15380_t:CDS:2 [Funneliformis geosporum]CAI2173018.1 3142_t:CDS:2 [Funneliformis geosporum]